MIKGKSVSGKLTDYVVKDNVATFKVGAIKLVFPGVKELNIVSDALARAAEKGAEVNVTYKEYPEGKVIRGSNVIGNCLTTITKA